MKKYIWLLVPALLAGCHSDDNDAPVNPVEVTLASDFNSGADGWQHGFSDYPVDNKDIFQLSAGIENITGEAAKKGYKLSGSNRSDDLFMYLKRPVTGLVANTRYQVTLDVTLWSRVGSACFGIGGSPGSSVYIKAGASEQEPKQADYYLNIDAGHQSQGGSDAKVIGDIVIQGLECEGDIFDSKQLQLNQQQNFQITSSNDGEIWLLVGSDSGYEGVTTIYYESINATITPL